MTTWDVQFVTCGRDEAGEWRLRSINDEPVAGPERSESPAAFLVRTGATGWELVSFQFVPSRSLLRSVPTDPAELSVLAGHPVSPPREEQLHGGNLVMVLKRPCAAER
jgi:hypothetical protein